MEANLDNSTFIWRQLEKLKEEQRNKEIFQELELPLYNPDNIVYNDPREEIDEEKDRGVIIIQF